MAGDETFIFRSLVCDRVGRSADRFRLRAMIMRRAAHIQPAAAFRQSLLAAFAAILPIAVPPLATAAPVVSRLAREAVEMGLRKSGREATEKVARESLEQAVETAVSKYGPEAAQAVADGGVELLEAAGRYGDDLIRVAAEASPAGRRALALEPGRMLPLVREFGQEAIELEARTPGLSRRIFTSFGTDAGRQIARQVPAEDLPRLLKYGERADSPQTRQLLVEAYRSEGPAIFRRIPPGLVLASGLTAAMIYGTHRVTEPFAAAGDAIGTHPEHASLFIRGMLVIAGVVAIVATVFILGAFRLTPWHGIRPKPPASESGAAAATEQATATAAADSREVD